MWLFGRWFVGSKANGKNDFALRARAKKTAVRISQFRREPDPRASFTARPPFSVGFPISWMDSHFHPRVGNSGCEADMLVLLFQNLPGELGGQLKPGGSRGGREGNRDISILEITSTGNKRSFAQNSESNQTLDANFGHGLKAGHASHVGIG